MDFKKRLKQRLTLSIFYIVLGIVIIIVANVTKTNNDFVSSFGLILAVIGIGQIRKNSLIARSEDRIKRQEIRETDERNLEIMHKAKSLTFSLFIIIAGSAVIVLQLMNKPELALPIAQVVCVFLMLYWVSYFIIRRKY
ncbi:MAG: hypothetical protein PHE51_06870 [Eubacteriales bacterium]|nr:hypothetical protein [Eubacteriales bacterium]